MFQPSQEVMEVLNKYDATYRRHRCHNECYVQIIDRTTGKVYTVTDKDGIAVPLEVSGADYQDALAKACKLIPTATKPMTRAQAASMSAILEDKDAEIARLRAELEEASKPKPNRRGTPVVQPIEA